MLEASVIVIRRVVGASGKSISSVVFLLICMTVIHDSTIRYTILRVMQEIYFQWYLKSFL